MPQPLVDQVVASLQVDKPDLRPNFEFAAVVGPICCSPDSVKIGSTELKEFVGKPGTVIPPF